MLNRRLKPLTALLRGLRPKQAAKNLFVYAALVFLAGRQLFDPTAFERVTLAFLLFSVASGSVYLLNDILDVEQDRQHPKKRFRPIASGDLPLPLARVALVVLAAASCAAGWFLKPLFGLTLVCYILMNVAYCIKLKHVVLLDVFTIAAA